MKYNTLTCLLFWLVLTNITIFGQGKIKVEGSMKNSSDSTSLPSLNLNFSSKERKIQGITDQNGYFQMNLPSGEYELSIQYMGSKKKINDYPIIIEKDSVNLGIMYVMLNDIELKEVTISAKKPFIKYEPNQMLIDLSANPATANGSAAEGILKIPGVSVSSMGNISLYGLYAISVYIDNRPSNMTILQLYDYLSSISVNDLEIVELITNPGPRYGKNTQVVLNIKLKRKAQEGINGFISGAGEYFDSFSGRFSGRLNMNKGISKNYISYSFSDYRRMYSTEINTTPKDSSFSMLNFNLKEEEHLKPQQAQWLNIGSDLALNEQNMLGAKISIGNTISNFNNQSYLKTQTSDIPSTSIIDLDYNAFLGNLYYALNNSKVEWTNNLDYSENNLTRDNRQEANMQQQIQQLEEQYHLYRFSSDLTMNLSQKMILSAGVNGEFTDLSSQSKNNLAKSVYDYSENNTAIYSSLKYNSKNYFLTAGLRFNREQNHGRFENLEYNVDTCLFILQPSFLFVKNLNSISQIKLAYNKTYIRPDYRDVIPFVNNTGTSVRRLGNPALKISFEDQLSLSYIFLKSGSIGLSYSHIANPIVEAIVTSPTEFTLYKSNLDQSNYFRFLLVSPTIPYLKSRQWSGVTYFAIHRQFDKGQINNQPYSADFTTFFFQHKEIISLPSKWYFDAQLTYYSPLIFGIYQMEKQWWIDISINKTWKDFRIALQANDLFNTNKAHGKYEGVFSTLGFSKNWNYPDIRLSLTYNFGKKRMDTYKNKGAMKNLDRININPDQGISDKKM